MKKVVLKVELFDEKIKQKAMKAVSGLPGLEAIEINMKDNKLTVTGDIDPVNVVAKLRKFCSTQILTVGPEKEEKKKEEPKKEADMVLPVKTYLMPYYQQYHPTPMHYRPVVDEDPNGCVIC